MSKQFVDRESYMHKCAKEVLKKWFDDSKSKNAGYKGIGDIVFRPNRDSGVWLEYPILDFGNGISSLSQNWDEIVSPEYAGGISEFVPTYKQCVERYKIAPIAIIDIVCTHKGAPSYGIEICHKNAVSEEKIQKIIDLNEQRNFGFKLIEINASWILSQIEPPSKLEYKRLM